MNWVEFKTTDFLLSKIAQKHGLEFACHVENMGYWKNIHGYATLMLVYDGNSYRAFYNKEYLPSGISYA